jgi:hypothetical protein
MTFCGNTAPHEPHPWAIAANPGEDGPDLFRCDGRPLLPAVLGNTGWIPLGRVDTSRWEYRR